MLQGIQRLLEVNRIELNEDKTTDINKAIDKKEVPMGEVIAKPFGEEAFTIGFAACECDAGIYLRPTFWVPPATRRST